MTLHIFGASGAVGQFLCSRLQDANVDFVALSRHLPGGDDKQITQWKVCDLLQDFGPSMATAIISAGPLDTFANWLARVQTPQLSRVVALGSMSIEAKRESPDLAEQAIALRLQQAESKLRETCDQRGILWTILRPALIWGSGRDQNLALLFRLAQRWPIVPIPMAAGGLRQPVHAEDVAHACCLALNEVETYNQVIALGGGERVRVRAMWSRVIRLAGAWPFPIPLPLLRLGALFAGSRSYALATALGRWRADQVVEPELPPTLRGWQPRGFNP